MNIAAVMIWLGRFVFLALLYFFLYRIYRSLMTANEPPWRQVPEGGKDDKPVNEFRARVVLVQTGPTTDVWLEEQRGKERRLDEGSSVDVGTLLSVGRGQGNRVRITDPFVSSQHVVIRPNTTGYFIEDLGSTNGTVVDGATIRGVAALCSDCVIQVGSIRFRFEVT